MIISKNFIGGNIKVISIIDDLVILENEIRDTSADWFYWAFCVENAGGHTVTFKFQQNDRVGYYGAAVSHDLEKWVWSDNTGDNESFTYTFEENENKVYFAHHMLYHPNVFQKVIKELGLNVKTLCISEKGRKVPYVEFGDGDKVVLLTARHHACESTGNHVLEGFLRQVVEEPIEGYKFICVPFVDYDGVVDGDQGKMRIPHDHNRDYSFEDKPIYNSVKQIQKYADENNIVFAFDFHSPWHIGGLNDKVFIPQSTIRKLYRLNRFGEILEKYNTNDAMTYLHEYDVPPNTDWNRVPRKSFGCYMNELDNVHMASSFETTYFGVGDTKFSQSRAIKTGKHFAQAFKEYIKEMS